MTTKRLQYVPTVREFSDLPAPSAFELGTAFYVQQDATFYETDGSDWTPVDLSDPTQYVSVTGDTMTGELSMQAAIDMNSNRILDLPTPVAATDAARKQYVDNSIATLQSYVDNGDSAQQSYTDAEVASATVYLEGLIDSATIDTSAFLVRTGDTMSGDLNFDGNDATNLGVVDFSTVIAGTAGEGQLTWNADDGTLDLGMLGGNVTQQVGLEQYIRAQEDSGSGIENGKVYYFTGATGGVKKVALALADSAATSRTAIGVATETVSGAAKAFITTFGYVRDIPDALFTNVTEGEPVYLSHTTPGGLTSTPVPAPNKCVRVGYALRKQSNNNELFVSMQQAPTIGELCDVELTSPVAGQVLQLDSAGVWRNVTLP